MSEILSFKSRDTRLDFSREQWLRLHPEHIDKHDVLRPLSRLLSLHFAATQSMQNVQSIFLNQPSSSRPYIVGVAGSVSVGKSDFAQSLLANLGKWGMSSNVQLVTTDSFLFPLATLRVENLLDRKGFPESYNRSMIFDFLNSIRLGLGFEVPAYSHKIYDVVAGHYQHIQSPDIIILEGLNVCQIDPNSSENILDYVDFSIYLDAPEPLIKNWYIERFIRLKNEAAQGQGSFSSRFKNLSTSQAKVIALEQWERINSANLRDNIIPSRDNADLIIEKSAGHILNRFKLRAF